MFHCGGDFISTQRKNQKKNMMYIEKIISGKSPQAMLTSFDCIMR